ncbi:MAG: tripartite tricarboxylate transporter permease [Eubacteriales bacterium]|nr:tripartite tricarboxylate transporter permease [Eubacteriales bacterium]
MDYLGAIQTVFTPNCLLCIVLGVLVGLVVGTLPGLTSVMAVSLITPLTFKMDPVNGFGMLLGVYNSAIFSGGISAIAINTPGTPASIATTFDGFTLSKNGRAGFALGVNTIYSVMGGIFSTIVLMIACKPLAGLALKFGSAEYFWLALFGLSMMISISHTSLAKGLIVGFAGLALSTVGLDPLLGLKRYVGNNVSLLDGITFIPVMIGLFGIGEMLSQIFDNEKNRSKDDVAVVKDSVFPSKKEHERMTLPALIGSVIGVVVGIIPGTGGDISALVSWDVCKRVSKHPDEYGHGSIEGLAATCASNNASIGGALTTALALGIPGDSSTAVLLGALTMYGMVTGPTLLTKSGDFVGRLYIIMLVANIFILPLGLLLARGCIKLLSVKSQYIQMAVLLICCIGAYSLNRSYTDVIIMFIFGIVGFFFRKFDYPLGPLVLGLLLGEMCETNLRRTLMLSKGNPVRLFTNPISIILIVLIIIAIGWPFIGKLRKKK